MGRAGPVRLDPAQWPRVRAAFDEAVTLPPDDRAAFLAEACDGDAALRKEVEALLDADAAGMRLGASVEDAAGCLLTAMQEHDEAVFPGVAVGPYRTVRVLGRGGMGTVYLAERADGQFEHRVALKLVRPGADPERFLRRFLDERAILARLNHPHIARLLDGGRTVPTLDAPEGQPYFTMEYVEGQTITEYADTHRLSIEARLALFEAVCEAVHYAHQHLVVHRDLKPSNILVTEEGTARKPTVKLLDFGIAKVLPGTDGADGETDGGRSGEERTRVPVMTPEYAAPEQVRGAPVTTATDVYALGLVLYELVAGRRPFRLSGLTTAERERVICEEPPARPSAAAGRTTEGPPPEAVAAARGTTAERLRRRLAGDLDAVVLKALAKGPSRRYASAEALLDDLRRHRGGLPVRARPASAAYRVRAFVRRHRAGVAAGAAFVVVLLAAVVALALTQQRTARERDRANREAAEADLARDFALGLFALADPDETRGDTLTTEQLLDQGAARALGDLAGEPEVQEEILLALADINVRLNRFEEAEAQYAHVEAQRMARLGAGHPGVAEALAGMGTLAFELGALGRADSLLGRAVAIQRRHGDDAGLARSLYTSGALARMQGDYAAAEARHRESLALRRVRFGVRSEEVAASLMSLAHLHHTTGAYDEAEARYREALTLQVSLSGEYHTLVASICNALASLLRTRGDFAASDSLYRRALAVQQRLTPGDRLDIAVVLGQWAHLLRERGQPEAAEARAREALAMTRRLGEDGSDVAALALTALGRSLTEQGRYAEAIPVHERVLALYEANAGPGHWQTGVAAYDLAAAHLGRGDVATAGALYRRADALFAPEPDSIGRETALLGLGRAALAAGQPAAAESPLRRSLAIRTAQLGAEHPQTAEAQSWLGACLLAQGRFAEARPLLLASARVLDREARRSIHEAVRANLATYRAAR